MSFVAEVPVLFIGGELFGHTVNIIRKFWIYWLENVSSVQYSY